MSRPKQMKGLLCRLAAFLVLTGGVLSASDVTLEKMALNGRIQGQSFAFDIDCTATAAFAGARIPLLRGDIALTSAAAGKGWRFVFDDREGAYVLEILGGDAPVSVQATFAAKASPDPQNAFWHTVSITPAAAPLRSVEVEADRADLELEFSGAIRRRQETRDGHLVVSALLCPAASLQVRWKAQQEIVEAKLLASSEANTIITVSPGALRADHLFTYTISQGALDHLRLLVPKDLSVTQVRGEHLRDWHLEDGKDGQVLVVRLSRRQSKSYQLQVLGEATLPPLPGDAKLPVVTPLDGTRADGFVALGTNSAIQLQIKDSAGVSQVDATAFPRVTLGKDQPRPIPSSKTFYYSFAATPYTVDISLADIVPSFDVEQRLVMTIKDDDFVVEADVELDVRDAPIRRFEIAVPKDLIVANVTGKQVSDYAVSAASDSAAQQTISVSFREAVLGRTLLSFKLELGESPIGKERVVAAFATPGARNQRGFIAIVSGSGVLIENPKIKALRQVHTRALPTRVPNAQFAWRFRDAEWELSLNIRERPAKVRVESFHLLSLGESVAYGSVAFTYLISGAPVDELAFRLSPKLENVQFVGLDVSRWFQDGELLRVKLRRKVFGDYNLGVTFHQRYADGETVLAGGVVCAEVETQTGFLTVSSHRSVRLSSTQVAPALIPIGSEETPAQYRLLVNAPILKSYKYVTTPHELELRVDSFDRGATPPVIVEFVSAQTQLSLGEKGEAESVTRVRYTVKNSSAQFLDLEVPKGLQIWGSRLIQTSPKGTETSQRIQVAQDGQQLKIPLKRQRNPNTPLTVEIEYAQVHGKIGWFGKLDFALPVCLVESTYADWHIHAPQGWSLRAVEGGTANSKEIQTNPLLAFTSALAASWKRAFSGWVMVVIAILFGGGAAIAILVGKRGVTILLVVVALSFLALFGMRARYQDEWSPSSYRSASQSVSLNQVLDLDASTPVSAAVQVQRAWHQDVNLGTCVVLGLLTLACFAWFVRGGCCRKAAGLAAVSTACLCVLQFPVVYPVAYHAFTWGLPVFFLVLIVLRLLMLGFSLRPLPGANVLLIALLFLAVSGVRAGEAQAPAQMKTLQLPVKDVVVEACATSIKAQEDSVEIGLKLTLNSSGGGVVAVARDHAILLEMPSGKGISWSKRQGFIILHIPAGKHEAQLRLLLPLAPAGEDQQQRFAMPIPKALRNQLEGVIPGKDLDVAVAGAVHLASETADTETKFSAILPPLDQVQLSWKPRERRTQLEKTVFYAEIASLSRVDSGLVETVHQVDLRVAQGELSRIEISIPEKMTVTRVASPLLSNWRFDPGTDRLQIGLEKPVTTDCALEISTQLSANSMPYTASMRGLRVVDASRQRASQALLASPAVNMTIRTHPQPMNSADFLRTASQLVKKQQEVWGRDVLYAYRMSDPDAVITAEVSAVSAEIRTLEETSFSIADERLVLNAIFTVEISKSGRFSVDIPLPEGYDVDTLSCGDISHWDEITQEGVRLARAYFKRNLLGETRLNLALSQSISALPKSVSVPKLSILGSIKHRGKLIVSSERGVRLSVTERDGVSEEDLPQLGRQTKPALVFKLLRPDWRLQLATDSLAPRVSVTFLHLAEVSDGLVKRRDLLRYHLQNAGTKVLRIKVPKEALGLQLSGPDIARKILVDADSGEWRIELGGKWFGRPYPLEVNYETRFDRETGMLPIVSSQALDTDFQRGFVVVRTTSRVELAEGKMTAIQPAEARTLSGQFPGAGNLADAAFCYASSTPDYLLNLKATRHDAASLLEARVQSATIVSVVNRQQDSIHQVTLQLRAGGKRYLRARLPAQSRIWSLLVDRQSRIPSFSDDQGERILQIPLPQGTGGELSVAVEMIYILPREADSSRSIHEHQGPRFDLPLNSITWMFYVPEEFDYDDFGGTLISAEHFVQRPNISRYDIQTYRQETQRLNSYDLQKAVQLQQQGLAMAKQGRQKAARQALEQAYNYSMADRGLNEDARVNLRNLLKQQAVVGLIGRRNTMRSEAENNAGDAGGKLLEVQGPSRINAPLIQGDTFTPEQAEQMRSSLSRDDNRNLEKITNQIIEIQAAAAGVGMQLMVKPPLQGRMLTFRRALQVKPDTEMSVSFRGHRKRQSSWFASVAWELALFLLFVLAALFPKYLLAGWTPRREAPAQASFPEEPEEEDSGENADVAEFPGGDSEAVTAAVPKAEGASPLETGEPDAPPEELPKEPGIPGTGGDDHV